MYQVSNAFLEQMKSPIQEHKITGTIGSVSFDEANIVEGSFSISNQSTDTNDVVLGSCYVGQLTAEFVGINIEYGKWINKTITLSFGLKVGEYYEYVPLGVFKIKEAKHTDHGVQVTAYDNMIKFDKKFRKSHFMNLSGMTNIIDQLCTDAGVVCGMSHAQIEALPNGDRTGINIYGSKGKKAEFANDITTLRDLLFWVAQTLGCFATMNRAGQLEFRPYTQNVVDEISDKYRIAGATFADYVTHYVGIYVENLDDNTEDYYGYDTTALQSELAETMGEITQDQEDITDLEDERAEWVQKLANHECTQEEYDTAIAEIDAQEKALTKEINQLSKRAEWLSNAIAQSADDGSDMVLGANPLTMAVNKTTRDEQRREILGALNNISYTPFQASVVCGCIYDLGDVIQFSGGLYNSDTDSFGCVMSYTYTHNGGTELDGFGVDPSVVVVRNKTQKSTDRAGRNASIALNENDLVFDIDKDNNNKVVATNKEAFEQTSMTRKWKMWEYNFNFPEGQNWSKWDVEVTMPYPFSISIWPDLDHGNPRYCSFNGKTYQSMCVGLAIRPNSNIGAWTYITSQSWTRYAGNQSTGYNDFGTYVHRRNNLNYYNTSTSVGTIMYGPVDLNDVDYVFNNINEWYAAMDNGTMEIPTVSPDDECVLATESTAKQAAANVEYIAEKLAGNNPSRESETYNGNVNVMSEKTMQRMSNAFYSMGENIGNITNNVDDVKVDGTSVVTSKVANINTMTGATEQADGAKGLVPTPTTTDAEKYLKGDGTWGEPQGVARALSELTDVELTNLSDGEILKYDATENKWVNAEDGGNANLFGTSATPSNSLGKDGDRYYVLTRASEVYNYLKWEITKTRNSSSGYCTCGEIDFIDSNNVVYNWSGTSVACNTATISWASGYSKETLIDGDYNKGPVFTRVPTAQNPIIFTLTLGTPIDFDANEYTFRVYDEKDRAITNLSAKDDPVTFKLYGSKDGVEWLLLDEADNSDMTFPYTKQIGSIEHYELEGTVLIKLDGQWQLDVDGEKSVVANPTATATENLTKVGIDGTVYAVTDADAVHSADVGVAGGVAELDSNGRVPSSQLPSYVDDVVEYASRSAFPATGESGKIYVALDTNLAYRWGGSEYVEISPSLALGETSSTAYRGDRGKAAYDHTQLFPIVDGKVCIVFER